MNFKVIYIDISQAVAKGNFIYCLKEIVDFDLISMLTLGGFIGRCLISFLDFNHCLQHLSYLGS